MSYTIEATIVLAILFSMSLLGSFVIFRFLKGTAFIKRKSVRLGGAAAMFVVIFVLLNQYLPEIRRGLFEEVQAAQPVTRLTEQGVTEIAQVSLYPSTQIVTLQDLHRLDRNTYQIYEDFGIALPRPVNSQWELNKFDSIPTIGVLDIPLLGLTFESLRAHFEGDRPAILGIRMREMHSIDLEDESTIESIPININIFDDFDLFKGMMRFEKELMLGSITEKMEISDEKARERQKLMSSLFLLYVQNKLPLRGNICSGVYVVPLPKELMEGLPMVYAFSKTLLSKAFSLVRLLGYLKSTTFRDLYIDQKKQIASFNTSVELGNVKIDGRTTDAILNNIGFIVAGRERAVFVQMIYLSIDDISVLKELEKFLNDLQLTA